MQNLPKNWVEEVPLLDVSQVYTGKKDANFASENGEYNFFTCAYEPLKADSYSFEGSVLIVPGNGANVGEVFYFDGKFEAYQRTYVIDKIKIEPLYLYYHLKKYWRSRGTNTQFGSATNYIKIGNFKDYRIELPPLPEQQRIVAKLDTLFANLEQVKSRLNKIPDLLKNFRQAVLNKEFAGTYNRELIGDLCHKVQDGAHHSPKNQYVDNDGSKFLYITSKNIRNNYMKLDNIVYVDKEFHDSIYYRCTPELGDVLLTKDGANTGNVTLNTIEEPFSLLSSVCLIKTKKELLSPSYLKYYIQSPIGFKELVGEMTGTAIKRIILRKIKNATIPVPSVEVQLKVVQRVEGLLSKADAIETQYNSLKSQIDSLPQAILAKAFKGELVEQLQTDGDAANLLKEIQQLKAEASKKKKK